ncbi:MAG TPA: GAF domain-containing protein, partial [Candidatus Sericytochromatia bacterium]
MVDSAYITENCVLVGDLYREASSTVAEATRSPFAKPLKALLPKDATDLPSQQTVNLVNLSPQLLQVAINQADDSQMLAEMAACRGKAFNADGCAIVLFDETTAKVRATGWFAEAPPLPLQPLEIASDYFDNWRTETALMPCRGMETVRSHPATASSVSKAFKVWQSIKQSRAALPPVRAVAGAAMHLQDHVHGVISLMRSRTHTWNQSEIAGLQTVSHQVASTFDQ